MKVLFLLLMMLAGVPGHSQNCELWDLKLKRSECNADRQFTVSIDFKYANASECFTVSGNGVHYGTYKYTDLPVSMGPFDGDCKTKYEFVVKDCKMENCKSAVNIGKVCCDSPGKCEISDIRWEKTDCKEGQFYLRLKFAYKNPSECFKVTGNGLEFGPYKYSQLPVEIGPFDGDCHTPYSFAIRDCGDEHCKGAFDVGKVCCNKPGVCEIGPIKWETTECRDGKFFTYLNFKYANTSECFKASVNGQSLGSFQYSDLPIKLGPFDGDCKTKYEFVVKDCKMENCKSAVNIGKVCCDSPGKCEIGDIRWEKTECKEGQFYVYLKFPYANTSECFTVSGNGVYHGTYKYTDLPVKIGPLKGDCNTEYEFLVTDCKIRDCRRDISIGKVCCDKARKEITELEVTKTECTQDKEFFFTLNFHYSGVSDSFELHMAPGLMAVYAYSQLPIRLGPFVADCQTEYSFRISDKADSQISAEKQFGKVCCETVKDDCKIYDLTAKPLECTGPGKFSVLLNFEYRNVSSREFEVFDRSGSLGSYLFAALPVKLENVRKSSEKMQLLKACEKDNPKCCQAIEYKGLDCFGGKDTAFALQAVRFAQEEDKIVIYSAVGFPDDFSIHAYDITGKKVFIDKIAVDEYSIELASGPLPKGIIAIQLRTQGFSITNKFLIGK